MEGELTLTAVLAAIRKGQVRVVSRPLTLRECAGIATELVAGSYGERARTGLDVRLLAKISKRLERARMRRRAA